MLSQTMHQLLKLFLCTTFRRILAEIPQWKIHIIAEIWNCDLPAKNLIHFAAIDLVEDWLILKFLEFDSLSSDHYIWGTTEQLSPASFSEHSLNFPPEYTP